MGHGNRWDAFAGGEPAAEAAWLRLLQQRGAAMPGETRRLLWPAHEGMAAQEQDSQATGRFLRHGSMGLCGLTLPVPGVGAPVLVTAYPFPLVTVPRQLQVVSVQEDSLGLEAQVEVRGADGQALTCLAADYFAAPSRYLPGAWLDIRLGAIGYAAAPAREDALVVKDPGRLQRYRRAGLAVPDQGPLRLDLRHRAMLLQKPGWDACDYDFRAPLLAQEGPDAAGLLQLRLTLLQGAGGLEAPLLLRQEALAAPAQPGQDLEGSLWLSCWLADTCWPDSPALTN